MTRAGGGSPCKWCGSSDVRSDAKFCSRACYWTHRHETKPRCAVDGCGQKQAAKLLCDRHYKQVRKRGATYAGRKDVGIEERFWRLVAEAGPDDCWEWQGHRNEHGYGRFELQYSPRVRTYSHRYAYQLATGVDVGDFVIRHACDNPPCCNPAHLAHGTQADNMRDAFQKGRMNTSGLALGWGRSRAS